MGRIVRRCQRLDVSAEFAHHERIHISVLVRHGRGEVRGEILWPGDDVIDGIPGAHSTEIGITDAVDRPAGEHALVQRIGVLNELIIEELDTEMAFAHRHSSRLIGLMSRVNGPG